MDKTVQKTFLVLFIWCAFCFALQPEIVFDTIYGGSRVDAISCITRTRAGSYLLGGYSNSFEDNLNINPWVFQMEHTGETGWFQRYPLPNTASVDVIEEYTDETMFFAGKTKDPDNKNNSIIIIIFTHISKKSQNILVNVIFGTISLFSNIKLVRPIWSVPMFTLPVEKLCLPYIAVTKSGLKFPNELYDISAIILSPSLQLITATL